MHCGVDYTATASFPVGESGQRAIILPHSSLAGLPTHQGQHQIIFTNSQGTSITTFRLFSPTETKILLQEALGAMLFQVVYCFRIIDSCLLVLLRILDLMFVLLSSSRFFLLAVFLLPHFIFSVSSRTHSVSLPLPFSSLVPHFLLFLFFSSFPCLIKGQP